MNSTSQTPGHKFPSSSKHNAMDNWGLIVTLAKAMGVAFLALLLVAAAQGANPLARLGYGILVCVPPAFGAFLLLKLTRLLLSWQGVVVVYFILLVLAVIIQGVGRVIPVYS